MSSREGQALATMTISRLVQDLARQCNHSRAAQPADWKPGIWWCLFFINGVSDNVINRFHVQRHRSPLETPGFELELIDSPAGMKKG